MKTVSRYEGVSWPWEPRVTDPSSAATVPHDIRSAIRKALLEAQPSGEAQPGASPGKIIATFSALGPADVISFTLTENTGVGLERPNAQIFYYAERPAHSGQPRVHFKAVKEADFFGRCVGHDERIIYDLKGTSPLEALAKDSTITAVEGLFTLAGHADDGWATAIGQAYRLAELEPDWDSYDAPAIQAGAIRQAVYVLTRLSQLQGAVEVPIVGPSPSGGVVLQWYLPHVEATMEIWEDSFEFFFAEPGTHRIGEHGVREAVELDHFLVQLREALARR